MNVRECPSRDKLGALCERGNDRMDAGVARGDVQRGQCSQQLEGVPPDSQFFTRLSQGRLNKVFSGLLPPSWKRDLGLMIAQPFRSFCEDEKQTIVARIKEDEDSSSST